MTAKCAPTCLKNFAKQGGLAAHRKFGNSPSSLAAARWGQRSVYLTISPLTALQRKNGKGISAKPQPREAWEQHAWRGRRRKHSYIASPPTCRKKQKTTGSSQPETLMMLGRLRAYRRFGGLRLHGLCRPRCFASWPGLTSRSAPKPKAWDMNRLSLPPRGLQDVCADSWCTFGAPTPHPSMHTPRLATTWTKITGRRGAMVAELSTFCALSSACFLKLWPTERRKDPSQHTSTASSHIAGVKVLLPLCFVVLGVSPALASATP